METENSQMMTYSVVELAVMGHVVAGLVVARTTSATHKAAKEKGDRDRVDLRKVLAGLKVDLHKDSAGHLEALVGLRALVDLRVPVDLLVAKAVPRKAQEGRGERNNLLSTLCASTQTMTECWTRQSWRHSPWSSAAAEGRRETEALNRDALKESAHKESAHNVPPVRAETTAKVLRAEGPCYFANSASRGWLAHPRWLFF